MGVSLLWGWLQLNTARPDLIPAEVVIAPPPAPEPVAVPDAKLLTPPTVLTRAGVVPVQPPPLVPSVPLTPAHVEPVTPPKAVEHVLPKPAEPRSKPSPAAKRPLPGPPPGPETKTFEKPKPGLLTPMPDEGPASPGANTQGPSAPNKPPDQPTKSIEGGEAGTGVDGLYSYQSQKWVRLSVNGLHLLDSEYFEVSTFDSANDGMVRASHTPC